MRILVKIGGAQLEDAQARARLCESVADARRRDHEVVLVHGGGNQIRALGRALNLPETYHDGLRVTDHAMAEVVLMVLAGKVNRMLVASLQDAAVPAVGLCGADGATFSATRMRRPGVDLGFVGEIDRVDPQLTDVLLASGYVPVIATVAPSEEGPFFNVNADHAAGPLCRALSCDALLFLTDVDGVRGDDGAVLTSLSMDQCRDLVANGTATGGMLPKLDAAQLAVRDNPAALVKIAPAASASAVLTALDERSGTRFVGPRPEEASHG